VSGPRWVLSSPTGEQRTDMHVARRLRPIEPPGGTAGEFTVSARFTDGVSVVEVRGSLDVSTSVQVRATVFKCLADEPELVVVDIDAMAVADDLALTVFPALAARAAAWPGCALVLVARQEPVLEALNRVGVYRRVRVYSSVQDAVSEAPRDVSPRRMQAQLLPSPSAATMARELVTRACANWALHKLAPVAELVVTELVSNVIRHAGTEMQVSVSHGERYLHVSVRDYSTALPRRLGDEVGEGRGLLVVEALTTAWGATPTAGGKAVWATLRT